MNAVLYQCESDDFQETEPVSLDTHIPNFHELLDWLRRRAEQNFEDN